MSRKHVLVIALVLCFSLVIGVAPAHAAPSGNGNGNAYAYGLIKQIDKDKKPKKDDVVVPPADDGTTPPPVVAFESWHPWSDVPNYVIPLSYGVSQGTIGTYSGCSLTSVYATDGRTTHALYSSYFNMGPATGSYSWNLAEHRIVYLFEGYTTVSVDGASYPVGSAGANALLADKSITWSCTYRTMASAGFNGWVVSELTGSR